MWMRNLQFHQNPFIFSPGYTIFLLLHLKNVTQHKCKLWAVLWRRICTPKFRVLFRRFSNCKSWFLWPLWGKLQTHLLYFHLCWYCELFTWPINTEKVKLFHWIFLCPPPLSPVEDRWLFIYGDISSGVLNCCFLCLSALWFWPISAIRVNQNNKAVGPKTEASSWKQL